MKTCKRCGERIERFGFPVLYITRYSGNSDLSGELIELCVDCERKVRKFLDEFKEKQGD